MALIIVAALVVVPLVLLLSDLVLNVRRADEQHIAYAKKVGTEVPAA